MGNNPGKQRNLDNFEREGYQSSPRDSSIKLMDGEEPIQDFRTPDSKKRSRSASGEGIE